MDLNPYDKTKIIAEPSDDDETGMGLALSGGGYRAMLFHVGSLWRLRDAQLLAGLKRISSVSGGSITAARLGLVWKQLDFSDHGESFRQLVAEPVRRMATHTIDVISFLDGLVSYGGVGGRIAAAYDKYLLANATLQALPLDEEGPRFVINATSLQTGALWRFSRPYMGDYHVGRAFDPPLSLATAVAASSGFPPPLSPVTIDLAPFRFKPDPGSDLCQPPYTTRAVLTDGGVYDNLGLEPLWKKRMALLVSDGGQSIQPEPKPSHNAIKQSLRVNGLIDNQVRALRKRMLIAAYNAEDAANHRTGAFWSIRSDPANYKIPAMPFDPDLARSLAAEPTRLAALPGGRQEQLINWGYAMCDVAIRRWVDPTLPMGSFPYAA